MTPTHASQALKYGSKVEFAFDDFPCGPCSAEAKAALCALSGILYAEFDACVHRATVFFDSASVDISAMMTALAPLALKPKVLSVVMPRMEVRTD